jgi:hypothetical protein
VNVRAILMRGVSLAAAVGACGWLALALGPFKGIVIWAAAVAMGCGVTALLMHRQSPPEKISWINYLAGFVLPWGYRIGNGKLWPIVVTSWAIWMLLGGAVVTAVATSRHDATRRDVATVTSADAQPQRSSIVTALLVLAWLVDGGFLLHCIGLLIRQSNRRHMIRSLGVPVLIVAAILVASVALVTINSTPAAARTALLIAGGPPLLIGGAYGGFILMMLTVGRNARWN